MDHSSHHHNQKHSQHNDRSKKGEDQHDHHAMSHNHGGHGVHGMHHHHADFLKRFWICIAITTPILVLSDMIQHWLGFHLDFKGKNYVLVALSAFTYAYGGTPFLKGMVTEIKTKALGMMTLVALAITVAFVYSSAVAFGLEGKDFFWELATLIDIMLLGHFFEMKSQMAASGALESLVQLLPSTVHVQRDGQVSDIKLQDLHTGDVIVIKPGEKIPADARIVEGNSYVNESMLTGESAPVKKAKGEQLIAGAVNGDGSMKAEVTGAGQDSYLNKVINLVQSAQGAKSKTQNLANKVAKWLTIVSLVAGIATFIFWYIKVGDMAEALERLVTVMVTACPHALGVAIPLVVAISTSKAATNGLLIRNRTAFENARKLTTIIFDKTGTVTKGSHEVQHVIPLGNDFEENELLQYAAAAQQSSEHYIGRGIISKLKKKDLDLWASSDFNYQQGVGVTATVKGKKVMVGGPNYFKENNTEMPDIPGEVDQESETVVFVLIDDKSQAVITLADSIRETSATAIKSLKEMNIRSILITGDNEKIAKAVSDKLGMDGYVANVLPHEKQEKLKEFQSKGEVVAMTGDGVNDAPALAQADVGIAIGSGTDVAAETADIILVNSDPMDVVNMIKFGKATYKKMLQNLFWAVGYNVLAVPLAAGVLYPWFVLSPAMGAVLMSLSTIIVAANAQLLRRDFKN